MHEHLFSHSVFSSVTNSWRIQWGHIFSLYSFMQFCLAVVIHVTSCSVNEFSISPSCHQHLLLKSFIFLLTYPRNRRGGSKQFTNAMVEKKESCTWVMYFSSVFFLRIGCDKSSSLYLFSAYFYSFWDTSLRCYHTKFKKSIWDISSFLFFIWNSITISHVHLLIWNIFPCLKLLGFTNWAAKPACLVKRGELKRPSGFYCSYQITWWHHQA